MTEVSNTVLQTVALSLPAVALYMTVLNDIYVKIEKAEKPMSQGGGAFAKMGPRVQPDEDNILRGFVTVTRSMNGFDFRIAAISLFFLVISAIFLILSLPIENPYLGWIGMGIAAIGFAFLALELAYTAYASFLMLYPESE